MSSSMGMLDPAYFVGRAALLSWLNDLLSLSYAKVEECANGAAYCQIIHSLHPTVVALHRVDFAARAQYAMVANYKVLQVAFTKLSIDRHVDVEKLIRGKYQDNLEFLQWLKGYYSTTGPEGGVPGYDPVGARGRAGAPTPRAGAGGRPTLGRPAPGTRPTPGVRPARGAAAAAGRPAPTPRVRTTTPKPPVPRHNAGGGGSAGVSSVAGLRSEVVAAKAAAATAAEKTEALEGVVRELAADRDFYFGKLRAVEDMLKALPVGGGGAGGDAVAASVLDILYAADDEAAPGLGGADGEAPEEEAPEGEELLPGVEAALGGAAGEGEAADAGTPRADGGGGGLGAAGAEGGGAGGAGGTPTGELLEEEELDERGGFGGDTPIGEAAASPGTDLFSANVPDEELLTAP